MPIGLYAIQFITTSSTYKTDVIYIDQELAEGDGSAWATTFNSTSRINYDLWYQNGHTCIDIDYTSSNLELDQFIKVTKIF